MSGEFRKCEECDGEFFTRNSDQVSCSECLKPTKKKRKPKTTPPKKVLHHTELFLRYIPVDVKLHFKAWCAKRGVTMQEQLVRMMRGVLKKELEYGDPIDSERSKDLISV